MITQTTITEGQEDLADASGLHLVAISPEIFTAQLLPGTGIITVGRSSRCTVQVEDPMVSREHVRLHLEVENDVLSMAVEDPGSANGTRVREAVITRGERVPIVTGEEVAMGTTVLMVLDNRGPRRIRSHAYFEARVADECTRAAKTGRPFALARVRFAPDAPWNKVLPLLARGLRAPHVFAAYGPRDYEILFVDVGEHEVDTAIGGLLQATAAAELEATCGVAWYPKNGMTSDALLGTANALLSVRRGEPAQPDERAARIDGAPMQRVRDMAARVAASPINVLIVGECGVGKDVLAQLIHKLSPRAEKPFMALNCAALTPTLLESELFGYEKGSFTGALGAKAGLLEAANGGTVFLDEVGDMPAAMQASLLRVIEAREVRPVGALKSRPIDVRFISATNKDLDGAVTKGQFRDDLMFRLDVMRMKVPPLRERTDEIPALATTFVAAACLDAGRNASLLISEDVMDLLIGYRWPGNIRELKNVMERAVALCDGPEILPEHLPLERMGSPLDPFETQKLQRGTPSAATAEAALSLPPLTDPEKAGERQRILDALVASNWNQTRAAQKLGMPRRTFVSKLDQFGIPRPQKVAPAD